jgi:hypothetical protein
MPRFVPPKGRLLVHTFKEGVLSAVAHDLEIEVERWWVEVTESRIEGEAEASSLRVLYSMDGGRPHPSTLSRRDRKKIEANIVSDVLRPKKHPIIRFSAERPAADVESFAGELELCGKKRSVRVRLVRRDEKLLGELRIHQPDFGIKPFTAMMGTLRIKPEIVVIAELPADTIAS